MWITDPLVITGLPHGDGNGVAVPVRPATIPKTKTTARTMMALGVTSSPLQ
jgi:hypothetical protein